MKEIIVVIGLNDWNYGIPVAAFPDTFSAESFIKAEKAKYHDNILLFDTAIIPFYEEL